MTIRIETPDTYDAPVLDDLTWIAEEVWRSLLGEEELLVPEDAADDAFGWSAAVAVSGAWHGTVTVELSVAAAVELTTRMLALPAGEPAQDADVADAVGELVNMVGGNVKSLMPGPSELSLPMVAAGRAAHPSEVVETVRLGTTWNDQPLRFAVHVPR